MEELSLGSSLYMLAEDEKINGELSLIGSNENLFESAYNRHAPDKGLKQLIPVLDRLIDECSGFDNIRKYGVSDLHRAKVRTSLKRAVNAYYNHQVFGTEQGHAMHFLGINPVTGMEYFSPYSHPKNLHEHFINNILSQEEELYYSSINNFNAQYQEGHDNGSLEQKIFEHRETCSYLCALAENEKEKYRYTFLRGHLETINELVSNHASPEETQTEVSQIIENALSSYSRSNAVTMRDDFVRIIQQAMHDAVESVVGNKQLQPPRRKSGNLRLIAN